MNNQDLHTSQTLANIRCISLEDDIYHCVTYQVFMYCFMETAIFSYTQKEYSVIKIVKPQ